MLKKINLIKLAFCIVVALLVSTFSYAQPPSTASLLARLKHSRADTNRVKIYKDLVTAYRNQKPDSAMFYAKQGLALATKLDYVLGIGLMHGQIGALDVRIGNLDSAKSHVLIALNIFEKLHYTPGTVVAHNTLGICFAKTGMYKESALHFLASLKINQEKNDIHGLVQSYIKLGALNEQINNLDKALDYYQKALKLNAQEPPPNAEASILMNLGIVYGKKVQTKQALKCFLDAIKKADHRDREFLALLYGNTGDVYQQAGDLKKAFDYQNEALLIARTVKLPEAEATTLINLASLKTITKPDTSLILLNQALNIVYGLHQLHLRLDIYAGLIEVYKHLGNYKASTETLEKRDDLKDSLFTLKNSKDIASLIANNELANSKIKVQQLQLSNARTKFQTWIILAVAICAIIILIIVMLFYQRTKELNKQLLHQSEELKGLNIFKDKLFSIISHDLRSPVATIVNLLTILEEDTATEEVKEFIPRLKQHSISTLDVMDKLLIWGQSQLKGATQNQTRFNIKDIIIQSLHLHQEAADQKKIELIDKMPDEALIFADSSHVEFVIRNLVANAVKYTRINGWVEVSAAINSPVGYTTIAIKDNGIGVAKSLQDKIFEPGNESIEGTGHEKGNSIGLMLCKEFVERNDGRIWVESELEKGTSFYVSFKQ
jgi:signal transduction histidine kinase/TPR repeat protein